MSNTKNKIKKKVRISVYYSQAEIVKNVFCGFDCKELSSELQTAIDVIMKKTVGGLEEEELTAVNRLQDLKAYSDKVYEEWSFKTIGLV